MKFLFILLFELTTQSILAQSQNNPYYEGSENDNIQSIGTPKPEILHKSDQQMIMDSVHRSLIRYKIEAYDMLYNLDSIYPDSVSRKKFERNPYILEYPEFEGYRFAPIYHVENTKADGIVGFYRVGLFEVNMNMRFISEDKTVTFGKPDTIYPEWPFLSKPCGYLDCTTSVLFHSPSKHLSIIGGCLPLEEFPRDDRFPFPISREQNTAAYYAQARCSGLMVSSDVKEFGMLWNYPFDKNSGVTSIGSMKLGGIDEGYEYFFLADDYYYCFPDYCGVRRPKPKPAAWLVRTKRPTRDKIFQRSHVSGYDVIPGTPWGDVEAIRFVEDDDWRLFGALGYQPQQKFKAYELRVRFKTNPTPQDTVIHCRGLTTEEIEELKKIDGLTPYRPSSWK